VLVFQGFFGIIKILHKKYKQKTVKRKIASLKVFYAYLEEEEIIEENPMRRVHTKFKEERVLPRIIPREEIEKLLNCMYKELRESEKNQRFILRDVAVVEVFFATGARVYEIANIRIENINLESGVIRFMGKGGKERIVQIGEESVIELLNRYYTENKEEIHACGYFFINKRKSRFTEQSIRLMLKKYTKQAKIERNITPHMFRHSFATYLIEEGVDISCVQQILGHSSIKTTQIYIHVSSQKQADILREMHPRNKMQIRAA
jgi:integrase/recombinase XerD